MSAVRNIATTQSVERNGASTIDPQKVTVSLCTQLPDRLTRQELADFWRVSVRTIERRELAGIGPRPIRIGGRVLYRLDDVLVWETAQQERGSG